MTAVKGANSHVFHEPQSKRRVNGVKKSSDWWLSASPPPPPSIPTSYLPSIPLPPCIFVTSISPLLLLRLIPYLSAHLFKVLAASAVISRRGAHRSTRQHLTKLPFSHSVAASPPRWETLPRGSSAQSSAELGSNLVEILG